MKKLLLSLIVLFIGFQAKAQYRFYAGIQGGPKLSFSNTTLLNGSMANLEINQSAPGKLKYQVGAFAGYHFRNSRFSLETGFSIHDHAMIAQFDKWDAYPEPPEIKFNYGTEQIHLLFKSVLNNPDSKVRIKFRMGGAWVFHNSGVQFEDLSIYNTNRKYEPYVFPYEADRPENFTFGPTKILYGAVVKENWLLLSGIEAETNVTSRLILNFSLQYQTSIRPVQAFGFEYNYNFQRYQNQNGGVFYEPMQYGTMQSKAEAFNLNFGIAYSFGKRNKIVE